ncbi:MAG: STM4015 family protein [Herpetosiphonaceae bacterium]|nr:STM4015 family protein [Herpetosiphonaceae bacterium]
MAIYAHTRHFAGTSIANWEPEETVGDPIGTQARIGVSYDDADGAWLDQLDALLSSPAAAETTALVFGMWSADGGDSAGIVEALVAGRDRLPKLQAIFIGDILYEEQEISWIQQSDVSPLFDAFPKLEHLCIRGANGLSLGALRHANLRSLVIQSGGLSRAVVAEVSAGQLPSLEHLELWLGDPNYGGDATVEDLAPLLAGGLFPKLRYLGLRDCAFADELAVAVATAPVLEQIKVLDLSLGVLSDAGAAALLASPAVAKLELLDLHHHYMSDELVERIKALGIQVDVSDQQKADINDDEINRYVAVSE